MRLYIVHGAPTLLYQQKIRIRLFYRPLNQYCIIWVMDMRNNISSGVSKSLFRRFRIKVEWNSAVILLWDIKKEKTKKYSIIVLRHGIYPHHMVYLVISLLIQLCFCY